MKYNTETILVLVASLFIVVHIFKEKCPLWIPMSLIAIAALVAYMR